MCLHLGVVGLHARAMTNGRDGRLIHAGSHFAASSPDMSLAGVVAAVIVERGQPRQGCDGLSREQAPTPSGGQAICGPLAARCPCTRGGWNHSSFSVRGSFFLHTKNSKISGYSLGNNPIGQAMASSQIPDHFNSIEGKF